VKKLFFRIIFCIFVIIIIIGHGHCHGNLHHGESADYYIGRKVIDVGCNLINYTPISYTDAIQKMEINGQKKRK